MEADGLTFIGGAESQDEIYRRLVTLQEGDAVDSDVGSLIPDTIRDLSPEVPSEPVTAGSVGGLVNPVPGAKLFDSFGFPRSNGRAHRGIDIFAPEGTPVVAVTGGIVVQVRGPGGRPEGKLGGRTVTMLGHDGRFYYYAHHQQNLVSEGDTVAQGDQIGLVGRTGNARTTAFHLHFGISVGGTAFSEDRAVNPFPLLTGGPSETPPMPLGPSPPSSPPTGTAPTTTSLTTSSPTTSSPTTTRPTTTRPTTAPADSSNPATYPAPNP
jgi:murein DD-endopeptidase MepM/ murein hydrolase activator NlpD